MTLLILFTFNILLLFIIRTEKKYWLSTIPIWILLILSFIIWRNIYDGKTKELDKAYWKSAEEKKMEDSENWRGDENIWKNLEASKAYVKKYNAEFLNSIFLQTILTFTAQLIGYKKTSAKKTYRWTVYLYGVILSLNLFLELLMKIIPTGPLV